MVAAGREIDHPLSESGLAAARRQHDARGLGGHHGLEVDLVEQQGLEQLGLDAAARDPDEGLVGEAERALRHCRYLAAEAKFGQVLEKARFEAELRQISELTFSEAHRADQLQRRPDPRRHQPAAMWGQMAGEELEDRRSIEPLAVIAGRHRELVEVAEQAHPGGVEKARVVGIHPGHGGSFSSTGPDTLSRSPERCPSGLRSALGKRVGGLPPRGFESHPLRSHPPFCLHFLKPLAVAT